MSAGSLSTFPQLLDICGLFSLLPGMLHFITASQNSSNQGLNLLSPSAKFLKCLSNRWTFPSRWLTVKEPSASSSLPSVTSTRLLQPLLPTQVNCFAPASLAARSKSAESAWVVNNTTLLTVLECSFLFLRKLLITFLKASWSGRLGSCVECATQIPAASAAFCNSAIPFCP